MPHEVRIQVVEGDALALDTDVLALKYAQASYGVDAAVAEVLRQAGEAPDHLTPRPDGFRLVAGRDAIGAGHVLFVGVAPLHEFGYRDIRAFARRALTALAGAKADTTHVALTVHGVGNGLDEGEAFEAEIAGLIDAIHSSDLPTDLKTITIVERNPGRASRLRARLNELLPLGFVWDRPKESGPVTERLRAVGYASDAKPHVFVAMPFAEAFDDTYHYGIQGAVHASGYLCERADLTAFVGDVMDWVKKRIRDSTLVIADLTAANPNVFLEVGYAWGCGIPTVLLVARTEDLKFDVQGQRCVVYKSIKHLEETLTQELESLRAGGVI